MKTTKLDQVYSLDEDFLAELQPREWWEVPEKRLLFAVLERAARDYLGARLLDVEASREWLLDDEADVSTPFSYGWVCDALGINPTEFRNRVLSAQERAPEAAVLRPIFSRTEAVTLAA